MKGKVIVLRRSPQLVKLIKDLRKTFPRDKTDSGLILTVLTEYLELRKSYFDINIQNDSKRAEINKVNEILILRSELEKREQELKKLHKVNTNGTD